MKICARCRQPLDSRRPDDHDCPDDLDPEPGDSSDEDEAA